MNSPRTTRIRDLADRAYEAARRSGGSAIEAAVLQIGVSFGRNRVINDRKLAVERAIRAGANAVQTRHRYGSVAMSWSPSVAASLQATVRDYRAAVRDRELREDNGFPTRHPDIEHRLLEAVLFLRWYRRFGDRDAFPLIVESLTTSPWLAAEAAE